MYQVNKIKISTKNINKVIDNQRSMLRYIHACRFDLAESVKEQILKKLGTKRKLRTTTAKREDFERRLYLKRLGNVIYKLKITEKAYQRGLTNLIFVQERLSEGIRLLEDWVETETYDLTECNGNECFYAELGNVDYSDHVIALPFILKYIHQIKA